MSAWLKRAFIASAIVAAAGYLAWTLSPWPSALFYRVLFDRGGVAMNDALAKHVPNDVVAQTGIAYADGDPDARLDIFRPAGSEGRPLPVIVWIHGGAFLSGSKDQVSNYLRIVAAQGYATVGVDYTLAPGGQYPRPVLQVNEALRFLRQNAARLGIDVAKITLAGDSAGAQIAGQITALISSPAYAAKLNVAPAVAREQLRGTILFCGFHDASGLDSADAFGGFLRTATWSYFGVRDFSTDPRAADFSTVKNVDGTFPPLFISAGNADPLLPQSVKLAEVARAKGVPVDSLFFPADHAPGLPHEYQFNLDNDAGQLALRRMLAFLETYAK